MSYTWIAISGRWKNTVIVALALILLSILSIVPVLGFIASVVQAIVLYALGYWVVDRIKESGSMDAFKEGVATEKIKTMMFAFFSPAAGYYVGFMIFSIIMMIVTVGIFWITGGFEMVAAMQHQQPGPDSSPEELYAFYVQIMGVSTPTILFLLITSLFFSYLWPLVYGYALFQRTFSDAFNAGIYRKLLQTRDTLDADPFRCRTCDGHQYRHRDSSAHRYSHASLDGLLHGNCLGGSLQSGR